MNTKKTNTQPTVVQWLDDQITKYPNAGGYIKIHMIDLNELIYMATEMEQEQISQAYKEGWDDATAKTITHVKENGVTSETH